MAYFFHEQILHLICIYLLYSVTELRRNEGILNLYFSPNFISVIKSRRIRLTERVASV
jgi:hypothetical protein